MKNLKSALQEFNDNKEIMLGGTPEKRKKRLLDQLKKIIAKKKTFFWIWFVIILLMFICCTILIYLDKIDIKHISTYCGLLGASVGGIILWLQNIWKQKNYAELMMEIFESIPAKDLHPLIQIILLKL